MLIFSPHTTVDQIKPSIKNWWGTHKEGTGPDILFLLWQALHKTLGRERHAQGGDGISHLYTLHSKLYKDTLQKSKSRTHRCTR